MKISILNQKGGVGKTTISVNLAYGLAKLSKKEILIIDLDPQGHSSLIFCQDPPRQMTVKEIFLDKGFDIKNIIHPAVVNGEKIERLFVIPSNIHLALVAEQILTQIHREKLLHNHLRKIEKMYDYILIDCPPTLNILTVNAIFTSDLILIPTTYSVYSLDGISDLFRSIRDVKEAEEYAYCILRNGYDVRNKQTNQFIEQNLEPYKKNVLKTVLRKSEPINQSQMNKEPVFTFDPKSHGTEDFTLLTKEIIKYGKETNHR